MAATAVILLLVLSFFAANLPWLSERVFLFWQPAGGTKHVAWRLAEWFVLYLIMGAVALGLEHKVTGVTHSQDWEFYVVTFCLFLVFALPGFIYRHDLRHHLERRKLRQR